MAHLDAGEHDAIILAQSLRADVLLMDDIGGRQETARRSLNVTGTLTILYFGAGRGFVEDSPAAVDQLLKTGFR